MKKGMFLMVLITLLVVPMVSYSETKEKCEVNCIDRCGTYNKNDQDFNNCMGVCMAECLPGKPTSSRNFPTTLKAGLDSSMPSAEAGMKKESVMNIVLASSRDDLDQPCYVGGKYVGDCSLNKPYYNAFSGECYSTLQDCKKADGDLKNVQGSGGCVRCGK